MARPNARQRGYGGKWERARAAFLAAHPWCAACERNGKLHRATVVDHIEPHKGDTKLFWSRSNWQPLCQPCHDRDKQQVERRGYADRIDASGIPTDPAHPFNRTSAEDHEEENARQRPRMGQREASSARPGGSKVRVDKGAGPVWVHRAELVSPPAGFRGAR